MAASAAAAAAFARRRAALVALALLLLAGPAPAQVPPSSGDFRVGNRMHLVLCNEDDQTQHYYVTSSDEKNPGQIWWGPESFHVAMFPAGNTGWPAELFLSPTIAGNPWERWTEANRSSGVTGIDNDFEDGNLCWRWVVQNGTLVAGAAVRVQLCSVASDAAQFKCDSPGPGLIEAMTASGDHSGLCVAPDAALSPSISLDDSSGSNAGVAYGGTGAIAGEGAARLLLDYDPAVAARVLDLLFTPGLLACIEVLKIEIGGDGAAVMGSTQVLQAKAATAHRLPLTRAPSPAPIRDAHAPILTLRRPSHQHAAGEVPVFTRGSQAWLAREARARNPAATIVALAWSMPGWLIVDGSPFGDCSGDGRGAPCRAADYIVSWVGGVAAAYGVTVDYVGVLSDYYDAAGVPGFVKALRARLTDEGLASVRIVCGEDGSWACAEAAQADSALLAAVDVFSSHGSAAPSGALRASLGGKPLWRTHQSSSGEAANLRGAAVMGVELNRVAAWASSVMVWGALCANYDGLPEHNNGLIRADSPTSGSFSVTPSLYAVAHTSRFARAGWLTLDPVKTYNGGQLARGGSFVMRYSPSGTEWSLVISKFLTGGSDQQNAWGVGPEYATFQLAGTFFSSKTAYVYVTDYAAVQNRNATFLFNTQNISIVSGHFSLWLAANTHVTITNVPSAALPALTPPAAPTAFPASFSSDAAWAGAAPAASPPFLADVNGAFEISLDPASGLNVARQAAASRPFTRYGTDTAPHAVLGNQQWEDVDARVEVFLPSASDGALFGVRCSTHSDSANNYITGLDHMPCIWMNVTSSSWAIVNRLDAAGAATLASGSLGAAVLPVGAWAQLRLSARGQRVVASAGGMLLAALSLAAEGAPFTPPAGFVGLGASAFGAQPLFRSLTVDAATSACSAPPSVNASLFVEACAAGSPGQNFTLLATGRDQSTAQLFVASAGLCVQSDAAADPPYRATRARRVYLAACDGTSDRQQFRLEMLGAQAPLDGNGLRVGPIQGVDGGCLGGIGNSDLDDTEIISFPWQAASTAMWVFDGAVGGTGTFVSAFGGYCLSACAPI